MKNIPQSEWVWHGEAGHFIGAPECLFHLNTRVGNYRVSTVGDYYPYRKGDDIGKRVDIGFNRAYETMVFSITGSDANGDIVDWSELERVKADTPEQAERNHMDTCQRYAALEA